MNNRILLTLFISAALLAVLSSCKTQRAVIKEPLKEAGAELLLSKLKEKELKFDWLTAKFSADYKNKDTEHSFGGQIRIRKDSLIWISLSPMMGIEVIRLMVSQDSVKFINRMNNTYFVGDYDYLNKFLNTNIDFDILQAFLIGRDLSFYDYDHFKATVDGHLYKLTTTDRQKLKNYVKSSEEEVKAFIQNIWLDPETYKITQADVKEVKREKQRLEATYGSFEPIQGQLFPMKMEYNIYADNNIFSTATFSKVTIDEPQQFPFKIPASFKPVKASDQ
jgi:outer membrane lipoprotein-sorting protein